jgi:hypothetical protein
MLTLALLLLTAPEGRLDLVCLGRGSANKQTSSSVYMSDSWGNSASGNITGNRSVPFDDQVNLWINETEGRLRMPRTMLPLIRGGDDGWFKIKDIAITESEIRGSVAVNLINNPKLVIDRRTGIIRLSGKAGRYVGECERYTPGEMPQRF